MHDESTGRRKNYRVSRPSPVAMSAAEYPSGDRRLAEASGGLI